MARFAFRLAGLRQELLSLRRDTFVDEHAVCDPPASSRADPPQMAPTSIAFRLFEDHRAGMTASGALPLPPSFNRFHPNLRAVSLAPISCPTSCERKGECLSAAKATLPDGRQSARPVARRSPAELRSLEVGRLPRRA